MKKLFFIAILVFISPFSYAQDTNSLTPIDGWIIISGTKEGKLFYRKSGIVHKDDIIGVWTLADFNSEQTSIEYGNYLSSVSRMEINCQEKSIRTIQVTSYTKRHAQGIAIATVQNRNSEWMLAIPNSLSESITNVLCITYGYD